MRILVLHNHYQQAGGEDTVFEQEVGLLRQNGLTVETLIFTNESFDGSWLGNLQSAAQAFYNSDSARRLAGVLDSFRPDVVHIHNLFYTASPAVILVARQRGIPVVMTLHNYRLVCANGLLMRPGQIPCEDCLTSAFPLAGIRHKCFRDSTAQTAHLTLLTGVHRLLNTWKQVDRFIVLTEFARQTFLRSSLHLKPEQVTVKPNSLVNLGYSPFAERADFFLYVGRLSNEKGIQTLIDAAYKASFPVHIIGDGPMLGLVQEAAQTLEHVHYLGVQPRQAVWDAIRQCRALVVPSLCYEGLPTVILEGFASGTPVICSDQKNLNQIIDHTQTGLLFKTGDSDDLVRTIRESESVDLEKLAQNGYQQYLASYTPERSFQGLMAIYEAVIAEQTAVPA
jgi:glycosyltransferase involved in cell wall biosynthesis